MSGPHVLFYDHEPISEANSNFRDRTLGMYKDREGRFLFVNRKRSGRGLEIFEVAGSDGIAAEASVGCPRFHFIFHVLFHFILHIYWNNMAI